MSHTPHDLAPSFYRPQPIQETLQSIPWGPLGLVVLLIALHFPFLLWLFVAAISLHLSCPRVMPTLFTHRWVKRIGGWKAIGVLMGALLFIGITCQADPVLAQLFDSAETEAQSTFGQYLDEGIIQFLFSLLRIVVWVSAVGFIFFAVYQAQRGEQWQPLVQNAFIIIAAVVVVEGLSALFFGS